jgi:hypothetical protein
MGMNSMVRFDSWERAAIFAGRMRDEGRRATMMDEGVAFLWGPAAVGGVRVMVSDLVLDEDEEWPEVEGVDHEAVWVLRSLVAFTPVVAAVMVLMRVFAEQGRSRSPVVEPAVVVEFLAKLVGFSAAMVVLGMLMTMATPFLRDEENPWSQTLRMTIAILLLPFV